MTIMTETKSIADDAVTRTLNDIVEEYGPDHVYERVRGLCEYFVDDQPSCIVGHVIARLSPGLKGVEGSVALNYEAFRKAGYSDTACAGLQLAQGMQDDGVSWGPSVKAACVAIWNGMSWRTDESLVGE